MPSKKPYTKLTPVLLGHIEGLAISGRNQREVAEQLEMHLDTLKRWLIRGRRELDAGQTDSLYAQVAAGFDRGAATAAVMALSEADLAAIVEHDARGSWRAAAWLLERRYPERWATAGNRRTPATAQAEANPFDSLDELGAKRQARGA